MPLSDLHAALDAHATAKSRDFWTRYLKGAAEFRGVPMASVRKCVHVWWKAEGLGDTKLSTQKRTALALFDSAYTEDKLAGVIAFSEILLPRLNRRDLPAFARLFAAGHIADWNICDWFCVKVLGKWLTIAEDPSALAAAIGAWRKSRPLWQRRAACVAFVNLAKHGDRDIPELPALLLENCRALVRDPARFAQTGVGWPLRELSIAEPDAVIAFAESHAQLLSREAMKSLAQKLPAPTRKRLLLLHSTH